MDILFSVIIPTYNRADLLKRCLNSLVTQTYQNWEAIIVDNFSDDNTEDVVSSFNDKRIRYIKNHNYGIISVSRNLGLDMAQGNYICFLDSDDSWFPNKLEIIKPYVEKYDLVYHDYRSNLKKTRPFQRIDSHFYEVKQPNIAYVLKRGDPFSPTCTCVSAKAIGTTRFSEERKFIAVEDYDFFLQLLHKGITIKKVNKVLAYYDVATGCSHNRAAIDRDRYVFTKYWPYLNEVDKRDVLKLYMNRKAGYFYGVGDYKAAIHYYKIAASSGASLIRRAAYYNILKAYILMTCNILFSK